MSNPQEAPIDITIRDIIKKNIIFRRLKMLNREHPLILNERIFSETMDEYVEQPRWLKIRFKPYQIVACILYKQSILYNEPKTDRQIANFIGITSLKDDETLYDKYYYP